MRGLLVVCAVVLIPNIGSAYYAAHMGRWTSRDPMADRIEGSRLTNSGAVLPRDVPVYDGGTVVSMTPSWDQGPQEYGYTDGYNLYQYVRSNPTAHTDPTGLIPPGYDTPWPGIGLPGSGIPSPTPGGRPIPGWGVPSDGTPCGNLTIQCDSGPKSWPVYGDSDKAGGILRPIGGSGCVTLVGPNRIICTGGCQAIKKWGSGGR